MLTDESDWYDTATLPNGSPLSYILQITKDYEPIATARLAIVRSPEMPALKSYIESLFDIQMSLQALEQQTQQPIERLVEFGRLAVRQAARDISLPAIFRAIMAGSYHVGLITNIKYFIAMTLPIFAATAQSVGGHFEKLADLTPRYDDPQAVREIVRSHSYYLPHLDTKYPKLENLNFIDDASDKELLNMIYGEPICPQLYWGSRERNVFIVNDIAG